MKRFILALLILFAPAAAMAQVIPPAGGQPSPVWFTGTSIAGGTIYHLENLTNTAQTVVTGSLIVDSIHCTNPNTAEVYVLLYDVASGTSVTVGTTPLKGYFGLPGNSAAAVSGASFVFPDSNGAFANGLKLAAVKDDGAMGGPPAFTTAPSNLIHCGWIVVR